MSTIKLIRRKMKECKAAYVRATSHFYRILDEITYKDFGENHPDILILSNGNIIMTWEDVDIDLEDILPYLSESGELTKESWYKVITNQGIENE